MTDTFKLPAKSSTANGVSQSTLIDSPAQPPIPPAKRLRTESPVQNQLPSSTPGVSANESDFATPAKPVLANKAPRKGRSTLRQLDKLIHDLTKKGSNETDSKLAALLEGKLAGIEDEFPWITQLSEDGQELVRSARALQLLDELAPHKEGDDPENPHAGGVANGLLRSEVSRVLAKIANENAKAVAELSEAQSRLQLADAMAAQQKKFYEMVKNIVG